MTERAAKLAGIILLACVMQGLAEGDIGLTGKVGTLGFGADLTFGLGPKVNARLGFNTFSHEFDPDEDEGDTVDPHVEINLQTICGLLDWHPWEGSFRLTGGVALNGNEILLTATPGDRVEIGESEYVVSDLQGEVSFADLSPYLGIGFGNAADSRSHWHFACDLGLLFHGTPDVSFDATATSAAQQAQLDADIAAEIDDITDDTDPFQFYPVATVGISYTF